jgi:hypothetical protein
MALARAPPLGGPELQGRVSAPCVPLEGLTNLKPLGFAKGILTRANESLRIGVDVGDIGGNRMTSVPPHL